MGEYAMSIFGQIGKSQLELYEKLFKNNECRGYWDDENRILITPDDIEAIKNRKEQK